MTTFRKWEPEITLNLNDIIFARMQSKYSKHLRLTLLTSVPEHDLFKGKVLMLVEIHCYFKGIEASPSNLPFFFILILLHSFQLLLREAEVYTEPSFTEPRFSQFFRFS